jgi:hypothetical protein
VQPTNRKLSILGIVRELYTETKKVSQLKELGEIGRKLLRLPDGPLWQVTLVVNSERPNLSYTCVLSTRLGLPRDAKNKIVFAAIEGRVAGDLAIWCVTEIQIL